MTIATTFAEECAVGEIRTIIQPTESNRRIFRKPVVHIVMVTLNMPSVTSFQQVPTVQKSNPRAKLNMAIF